MTKLISLKDVSYQVPYGAQIIESLSLDVAPGEFIGVLGHNGAGKTTLLELILGTRKSSSGKIEVLGEDPHALQRAHKASISFFSQDITLKGSLTIKEFLDFHAQFYPLYSDLEAQRLLRVFKLKEDKKIGSLSTGQQKKVQFIAGLSTKPRLILIDEITAVLDPETRNLFFNELDLILRKDGCSVVLATNIAEDLISRAHRILFLEGHHGSIHLPQDIPQLFNLKQVA